MLTTIYTAGRGVRKGKSKCLYPLAKANIKSSSRCHTPHQCTQCMPTQACVHSSGTTAMPISVSCDGVLGIQPFVLEEVGCNHQLTVQRQPNNPLDGNYFSATSSRDYIRNWWLRQMGTFLHFCINCIREGGFLSFDAAWSSLHLLSPVIPHSLQYWYTILPDQRMNWITLGIEGAVSLYVLRVFYGSSTKTFGNC